MSDTTGMILFFFIIYFAQFILVLSYVHDNVIKTRRAFLLWLIPFSWVGYLIYSFVKFVLGGIAKLK